MACLYFDETIRERGDFIIGALVVAENDISLNVRDEWIGLGLNPDSSEYKSSDPKEKNEIGVRQREVMANLLQHSRLALAVLPVSERLRLGEYCTDLIVQLSGEGIIENVTHQLFLDQNIALRKDDIARLTQIGVSAHPESDSRIVGGIQVADHAAHALGGMLLEEMGIIKKQVRAGENSGYHPDELLELGFELWASLRHALIGKNEYIEGLSPHPEDPANPFFRVDGVGLYIAPSCAKALSEQARKRFGVNYLGCIH